MNSDFQEHKYDSDTVFLKSRSANPFDSWADWYGTDGEAVVSFFHFKRVLYDAWRRQCISYEHPNCDHPDGFEGINETVNCDESVRLTNYENFDYSDVQRPGIRLDGVHYYDEDKVDESYTIVVPEEFLSPKLCGHWLDKLNHQYNRRFVLAVNPAQWIYYLEGEGSSIGMNSVMFDDKIDYEAVWNEIKDKDVEIPKNIVLTLKVESSEKEKWVEKFSNLYGDEAIKVVHTEEK